MSQIPKYLPQGIDYLGFLSQQLGDLTGKTTLAYELIQNADDAKDEAGHFCATRAAFDITDDALIVSNDAVFRETDYRRIQQVASGTKRAEKGDRPTGRFGVGFISVYQVTDRPEIHSAERVWVLRPDKPEHKRIKEVPNPSITKDDGTMFRLPWAIDETRVRKKLSAPTVNPEYIDLLVVELKNILPRAALFLKNLERLELLRNGEPLVILTRIATDSLIQINQDNELRCWYTSKGTFAPKATELKRKYNWIIDKDSDSRVRVAVPDSVINHGLLFATLPTEHETGLPFHIHADFYPASDRKTIEFGDPDEPRSEWNRAAIRAAVSVVSSNLIPLRNFYQDAASLWKFLWHVSMVHQHYKENTRLPLGEFWESLLPRLGQAPA